MVTLETGCSTQGHPTVFTVVSCFMPLKLNVVRNSADMDFALTLWQQCRWDNEVHSALSVEQFLVVCIMVSLLLYVVVSSDI
jgi:hypothetical protein